MFFDGIPEELFVDVLEIPTAAANFVKVIGERVKVNIFTQVWLSFEYIAQIRLGFVTVGEGRSDWNQLLSS